MGSVASGGRSGRRASWSTISESSPGGSPPGGGGMSGVSSDGGAMLALYPPAEAAKRAPVGRGHPVEQQRLGVGVAVVDADAPTGQVGRLDRGPGAEHRLVDGMAGHELLGLGGEGVGLLGEGHDSAL